MPDDYATYEFGEIERQSGQKLRNAFLAHKTHGELKATKSNVIVYTTPFGVRHVDTKWMIGSDMACRARTTLNSSNSALRELLGS